MDPYWWQDPSILFRADRYDQFFASPDAPLPTAFNALVRFAIYASLLLAVGTGNGRYILAVPVVMLVTYGLFELYPPDSQKATLKEHFSQVLRKTRPTISNPYMNVLPGDSPTRPDADDITKPEVANAADAALAAGGARSSVMSNYHRNFLERHFVTQPRTGTPGGDDPYRAIVGEVISTKYIGPHITHGTMAHLQ